MLDRPHRRSGREPQDPFARVLETATNYALRLVLMLVDDVNGLADKMIGNQRDLAERLDVQGRAIIALVQRLEALEGSNEPKKGSNEPERER